MTEFNESIRPLSTTDKNHADILNFAPEKLLENTKYNKEQIEALRDTLNEALSQFDDYLTTEELSKLLENGIKGDKGDIGYSAYQVAVNNGFVGTEEEWLLSLKGNDGEKGEPGEVTLEQLNQTKSDLEEEIANIPKVTKTSELTNDSGYITSSAIPTSLPASDVYAWAKASTKPSYTASEVGALASNGTAVNANKLINKNWYWSGQSGQPTWLWGGTDGTNMYVYNPSNFSVADSTKLGGVTLDQLREEIKKSGGDFMGKTLIITGVTTIAIGQAFTYTNSKGGLARIGLGNSRTFSVVADGVTIANGTAGDIAFRVDDGLSEIYVPFSSTVVINNTSQYSSVIRCHLYINK